MNELDSQARAIIEAARGADGPSPADRDRIKRAVFLQVAAVGALGSTVAGAAAAGTMSIGAKVGLAVLAVSLAGGGTVGVMKLRVAHKTAPAVAHQLPAKTVMAPKVETAAGEVQPAAPSPAASVNLDYKTRRGEKARKLAGPSEGEGERLMAEDQLNAEVAVLKRAREELRLGRPAQALQALDEYDRRFGKGALGEERQAMAAIAACQIQPGPSAQTQAEAFIRTSPNSPLVERVRSACSTLSPKVSP